MNTSLLAVADRSLTPDERSAFLDNFPQMRGAHVADILDILDNSDAYLEVVEPMYEHHGDEVPESRLLSTATYLCIGISGNAAGVTWEAVQPLVERIRQYSNGDRNGLNPR